MSDYNKQFNDIMMAHAHGRRVGDVFADWCRASAAVVSKSVCNLVFDESGSKECDSEFEDVAKRYGDDFNTWAGDALGVFICAIEDNRSEFLGNSLESLGMGNKQNGQFFTPSTVSDLCAKINCKGISETYNPGDIITLNDPCCGASVMMISSGEELIKLGVDQRDIYIDVGDVDKLSCDISLIELNYLGYAATVNHQDAISLKILSKPRRTIGYFLNGMHYRMNAK